MANTISIYHFNIQADIKILMIFIGQYRPVFVVVLEKVNKSVQEVRDTESNSKDKTTVYKAKIGEALYLDR